MNLPFMMGTELTGVHAGCNANCTYTNFFEFQNRLKEDIGAVKKGLNVPYHRIYQDVHCIEVSSKKLTTFAEYERFSLNTRKALSNRFYYPKNKNTVCGGAHIHVDMRGRKRFKYELARDLVMRPYLPWIFGEPDEIGSMDVLINYKTQVEKYRGAIQDNDCDCLYGSFASYNEEFLSALMNPYSEHINYTRMSDNLGKDHMFRLSPGYNTIEFRFFEMTETWEEQELQLNFLCKYLEWMKKRINLGESTKVVLITDKQMQAIKPEICVDLFNELCYDIGVESEDYKPFIKRNLYPRWSQGRVRR